MSKTLKGEVTRLRKHLNLSQQDVAERIDMRRSSYAVKERTGSFSDEELKLLAPVLGTTFDLLIGLERTPDKPGIVTNTPDFLVKSAIRQESMLKVIMWNVAELIAEQKNQAIARVIQKMEDDATSESLHRLNELQ